MDCPGWTIKCPDGAIRSFPYHNQGDAQFDTDYRNSNGCRFAVSSVRRPYDDDPPEWIDPPCPGGEHVAEPVVFAHPHKEE